MDRIQECQNALETHLGIPGTVGKFTPEGLASSFKGGALAREKAQSTEWHLENSLTDLRKQPIIKWPMNSIISDPGASPLGVTSYPKKHRTTPRSDRNGPDDVGTDQRVHSLI